MKISLHLVFVLMASTFGVSLLIASVVRTSAIDMPCAEAGDDMSPYVKEPLILRNDSRLRSLLLQENDMREALTADLHIPPTLLPVRTPGEWASALSKWEAEHGTAPFLRR